jgi:diguanylate cyclase (GGDEF)-like protein/PAS domain S-box-containing protein
MPNVHDSPAGAVVIDAEELKRTRDALDAALRELSFHMENSPLAMVEWTHEVKVKRWSRQAEIIFGWHAEEVIGKGYQEFGLLHPGDEETVRAGARELLDGHALRNRMLSRNITKDGRHIYCEWYNSAYMNDDGKIVSILSLAQDVTLRIEAEEQLKHLAVHDALTGLPNRQSLVARLEHAVTRGKRTGEVLAVLFIDLNRFKPVNDQYGHAVGDQLLKQAAERLKACVRDADTVARLGGDEFVVLLETDVTHVTPAFTAQRIDESLSHEYQIDGHSIPGSASIGISLFPDDGEEANMLLARADAAMYQAKHRE